MYLVPNRTLILINLRLRVKFLNIKFLKKRSVCDGVMNTENTKYGLIQLIGIANYECIVAIVIQNVVLAEFRASKKMIIEDIRNL